MAFNFKTPQWDSNTSVDKTCKELFLFNKKRTKRKAERTVIKEDPNVKHETSTSKKSSNKINKKKKNTFLNQKNIKNKIETSVTHKHFTKKSTTNSEFTLQKQNEPCLQASIKKKKNRKVEQTKHVKLNKKQNLNGREEFKMPSKPKKVLKKPHLLGVSERHSFTLSRKQKSKMSLRERMLEKLKSARFRYLNEQIYTNTGQDSKRYFEQNPNDYNAYHQGYRLQVSKWPLNPLDNIMEKINKMPKNYVIADFGCGEAKLAKSVPQLVHSFDLVAIDDSVTACDMRKVPLKNDSVDVVVFCLSLMGTNLKEYICEAARILKAGGLLKIAEVESRFENVDKFIQDLQKFGFAKPQKDLSHDLFWFIDFVKDTRKVQLHKLPDIHLNPCLYKRR